MDTAVSSLPLHCPGATPRPPLSRLKPVLPSRYPSLPSSPLHLRRLRDGSPLHHPTPPFSPLRSRRGSSNAATVAFSGWSNGRRKGGRRGVGLDKAAIETWASILLLAGSIQRLLVMQPLDVLVALLEHGGGATIGGGGGGDRALGLFRRGLSRVGRGKKAKRTWRRVVVLVIKVASAVAAAAAFWLLLSGRRLI